MLIILQTLFHVASPMTERSLDHSRFHDQRCTPASLSIVRQLQTPRSNASLVQPASSKGVTNTITTHCPVTDCQNQAGETERLQKYLETASHLRTRDGFLRHFQRLHSPASFNERLRTSCRLRSLLSFLCFRPVLFSHLSLTQNTDLGQGVYCVTDNGFRV